MATKSVYDIITDVIIKRLDAGVIPWRKPWRTFGPSRNLISGKPYRGINQFILGCAPFSSPFFVTFKQAKECGGFVRAGERSLPCVFWTEWQVEDKDTGEDKKIPVLRFYNVFNSEQCDGLNHARLAELLGADSPAAFNPIADAQAVVDGMPKRPAIQHTEPRAFYRPSTDTVNMPTPGLFVSPESYYDTLFHELGHSTGHASRLARKGIMDHHFFGDSDYGQEELVAEMTAAFLCGHCRIEQAIIENSAAYIGSWLRTIKQDAKLVVIAAAQAQKAADFILGASSAPVNGGAES